MSEKRHDNSTLSRSNRARRVRREDIVYAERRVRRVVKWYQVFSWYDVSRMTRHPVFSRPKDKYMLESKPVWHMPSWARPALEVVNHEIIWLDDIPF